MSCLKCDQNKQCTKTPLQPNTPNNDTLDYFFLLLLLLLAVAAFV